MLATIKRHSGIATIRKKYGLYFSNCCFMYILQTLYFI